MRSITQLLLAFVLVCTAPVLAFAQSQGTVAGRVLDAETGQALPGTTVTLQGTQLGAATGLDGQFSFQAPAGDYTLVVTFVGFLPYEAPITVRANQTTSANVRLQPDLVGLDEVVVTGYRVTRTRVENGAVSSVSGDQLQTLTVRSADQALQGRAPGVHVVSSSGQPGSGLQVRVRGAGSITAGSDPLYIVDGVQVNASSQLSYASGNPLNAIGPNDIASIEVLKDAAAASIYGAQAANGVVIITTKRGTPGRTEVNFSTQYGSVDRIKEFKVLNAQQYAQNRLEALINRYGDSQNIRDFAYSNFGDPANVTTDEDWQDAVFRTGITQTYNLSARGGTEKTTFYTAGRFTQDEGQVIASRMRQGAFRLNLDHYINDKLSGEAKVNLSTTRYRGTISDGPYINSPFWAAQFIPPNVAVYNEQGNPESGYNLKPNSTFSYNPVAQEDWNSRDATENQIIVSGALNYEIMPGLFSRSYAGVQHQDSQEERYDDPRMPQFASVGGRLAVIADRTTTFNLSQTFNYSNVFSSVHRVVGLAGTEYKESEQDDFWTRGQGFPNYLFRTLDTSAEPITASSTKTEYRQLSFFGNAEYTYDDTYQLSTTLRYDGSSRFGEDKRWGLFGNIAGYVRLSNMGFMDGLDFFNDLKLRASYGVTGNNQIGNFASRRLFAGAGDYINLPGIRPTSLGNNLLTWEENWETNVGLDYAIFDGRLAGSFDVYRRDVQELLLNRDLPIDSGFGGLTENVGEVRNEGLEIGVNTVNLDLGGFEWRTTFNIAFQRSEVMSLVGDDDEINVGCIYRVGEPVCQYEYARYAGVNPANGRPMYYDVDGNLTYDTSEEDEVLMGNTDPDYYGGIGNTFSYKGLTLDVFFQYDYGRVTLNNNAYFSDISGFNFNKSTRVLDRWQEPGDITAVPKPVWGGVYPDGTSEFQFTERFLEDASYVRLKQVTLNYALPNTLSSRIGVRSAAVWVTGENLATWTEFTDSDPEIIGNALGEYPQGKRVTAGVRIGL